MAPAWSQGAKMGRSMCGTLRVAACSSGWWGIMGPASLWPGAPMARSWPPVEEVVISGGRDGRLYWWDLPSGACLRVQQAHQGIVQALKVSPDGRRLASCGNDGTIRLWDLESGEHLRTLRRDRPYERLDITGIRGLTEAQKASLRALGAVEDEADEQSSRPEQAAEL